MKKTVKLAGVGLVLAGTLVLSVGCTKYTEPYRDAPRSGTTNDEPMDVIEMSDGFSNLGTKCDHGNRIYVAYKGDDNRAAIAVVRTIRLAPTST
jgi:hypothetical protein